ncbi:hypothetical protein KEM54_003096 [Ascosphaera aggregata]|nr:hypothetical protein KEM54_003096 [Ascosphaera aggregata]
MNEGLETDRDGCTITFTEENTEFSAIKDKEEEFSGLSILFLPKEDRPSLYSYRGLSRWAMGYWHAFLNWLSPANDEAADMDRVIMMMTEHVAKVAKYGRQFAALNRKLWYLEACCVRPSMQGKGTARALMEWVLKQVGNDACYLECTDEANVTFYNKFGFELYETVRFTHKGDDIRLYMMIRQ